jgi:hypothetical protein
MEWERIFILVFVIGSRVLSRPEGFFKGQPLPDVFQNASVW